MKLNPHLIRLVLVSGCFVALAGCTNTPAVTQATVASAAPPPPATIAAPAATSLPPTATPQPTTQAPYPVASATPQANESAASPVATALLTTPAPTVATYLPTVANPPAAIEADTYRVINTYPHDAGAFTQGLVYADGQLYEGTGQYGSSSLRRVKLETGEVLQKILLAPEYFGEGIALVGDRIHQLTWQSQIGFTYDKASFAQLGTFSYQGEGWGLTYDGTRLIMSDGTDTLRFLDPTTLTEIGRIQVSDDHGPVVRLNELEFVKGEVYANIWQTDRIARIDPETGRVVGWIDLTGLLTPQERLPPTDVLNGIAYDAEHDRLFVTGKYWPKLFEIKVVPHN